jgi:hypothetical protein
MRYFDMLLAMVKEYDTPPISIRYGGKELGICKNLIKDTDVLLLLRLIPFYLINHHKEWPKNALGIHGFAFVKHNVIGKYNEYRKKTLNTGGKGFI